MNITNETRQEAIDRLLKEKEELYVVDVLLSSEGTEETIEQFYIYANKEDADNYLGIVENYYIYLDESDLVDMWHLANSENSLEFKYNLDDCCISESITITRVERAA